MINHVVTVCRSGGEFTPRHVDWLWRQLVYDDIEFHVLTDMVDGSISPEINLHPLQQAYPGWWSKMEMFRPNFLNGDPFVYLDLDTVVRSLPLEVFHFHNNLIIRDFFQKTFGNSGLMWIVDRGDLWERFQRDPGAAMKACGNFGDGAFIRDHLKYQYWQDALPDTAFSFKAHVGYGELGEGTRPGQTPPRYWEPIKIKDPSVVCFHGKPRPWDRLVQENCPWVPRWTT